MYMIKIAGDPINLMWIMIKLDWYCLIWEFEVITIKSSSKSRTQKFEYPFLYSASTKTRTFETWIVSANFFILLKPFLKMSLSSFSLGSSSWILVVSSSNIARWNFLTVVWSMGISERIGWIKLLYLYTGGFQILPIYQDW